MNPPQRTPLHARHLELGARMTDFAGFSMPIQYGSIKAEHASVRQQAGLFDVSHMGQIQVQGSSAEACLESLLTCSVNDLVVGCVRYGLLCNETGGCLDDVTLYRDATDSFLLCVNAANIDRDFQWLRAHASAHCEVLNLSRTTALLALQGPNSAAILDPILAGPGTRAPSLLKRFRFDNWTWRDNPLRISRTGYTGSDGFEIYLAADSARSFFDRLLEEGKSEGLRPAGLGARDTLRLEAALPLYGHELDEETSPLEAGLERFVKRLRGGFMGHEAMEHKALQTDRLQLVGFELIDRGVARAGQLIFCDGQAVGRVTSGGPSPSLGKSIGLGYIPHSIAQSRSEFAVKVRENMLAAHRVQTPFVPRS